jgi:hypothetical protein
MSPYSIELLFDDVTASIDREDRRLQALENARGSLITDSFDLDGVAAMSRVMTYVVCGGLLERLMRDLPQALMIDVLAIGAVRNKLPIGLLAVIEAAAFRKCVTQSPIGVLARVELLQKVAQHANDARQVEDFVSDLVLADGTTIDTKQFEALWSILQLGGDWSNQVTDRLMLSELRSKRNEIAHWESDPVDIGRTRTYGDLRRMIRQLRDLLDHLCLNICDWLDTLASI